MNRANKIKFLELQLQQDRDWLFFFLASYIALGAGSEVLTQQINLQILWYIMQGIAFVVVLFMIAYYIDHNKLEKELKK